MQWTDDFIVDALHHYRLQHRARQPLMVLKVVMTFFLAGFAVLGFVHGSLLLGLFFIGLCVLLLFGHHIDLWLMRRSLRKWAFRDEVVRVYFADDGFHARSPKQETTLRWPSFKRVVCFRDGFLLFHGPSSFHWIPVASLAGSPGGAGLEQFLKEKITEHRTVEHVAASNDGPAASVDSSSAPSGPPSVS